MARVDVDKLRTLATAGAIREARIRSYADGYLLEIDYGDETSIVEKAHGGIRLFKTIDTPARLLIQHGMGEILIQAAGFHRISPKERQGLLL